MKRLLCWIRKPWIKGDGLGFLEDWRQKGHDWKSAVKELADGSRLSYWACSRCGTVTDGTRFFSIAYFNRSRLEYPSAKEIKCLLKTKVVGCCN